MSGTINYYIKQIFRQTNYFRANYRAKALSFERKQFVMCCVISKKENVFKVSIMRAATVIQTFLHRPRPPIYFTGLSFSHVAPITAIRKIVGVSSEEQGLGVEQ